MAMKAIVLFAMILALSRASPTRRHFAGITEASASEAPATSGGTDWDDSEDFDMDADDWFSKAAVSPSSVPPKSRQDTSEYDDDYSRGNVMVEFGDDDENDDEDDEDEHVQEAEEDDGSRNDSEFLFVPPKDSRLMLEDDDDDQSGPIKVRHTGRSNYQHESDDNSLESMEDDKDAEEHPYEFTIDQDDKASDEDDDEDEHRADDESAETSPRHVAHGDDDDEDDDEFVSEDGQDDMFDNPAEESAQVIYGDHVLLY